MPTSKPGCPSSERNSRKVRYNLAPPSATGFLPAAGPPNRERSPTPTGIRAAASPERVVRPAASNVEVPADINLAIFKKPIHARDFEADCRRGHELLCAYSFAKDRRVEAQLRRLITEMTQYADLAKSNVAHSRGIGVEVNPYARPWPAESEKVDGWTDASLSAKKSSEGANKSTQGFGKKVHLQTPAKVKLPKMTGVVCKGQPKVIRPKNEWKTIVCGKAVTKLLVEPKEQKKIAPIGLAPKKMLEIMSQEKAPNKAPLIVTIVPKEPPQKPTLNSIWQCVTYKKTPAKTAQDQSNYSNKRVKQSVQHRHREFITKNLSNEMDWTKFMNCGSRKPTQTVCSKSYASAVHHPLITGDDRNFPILVPLKTKTQTPKRPTPLNAVKLITPIPLNMVKHRVLDADITRRDFLMRNYMQKFDSVSLTFLKKLIKEMFLYKRIFGEDHYQTPTNKYFGGADLTDTPKKMLKRSHIESQADPDEVQSQTKQRIINSELDTLDSITNENAIIEIKEISNDDNYEPNDIESNIISSAFTEFKLDYGIDERCERL
ncbi:hypothetical protein niasHS_009114 [Heterodera schachtii]|uniref:Uncharacterized protein n=1 Tax=Heterodera schachtii TaxID=97005 RepID=A0ABD2JBF3_HETSC